MYHYVQKFNKELPYFKFLHIDDFKKQLDFLKNNYYFPSKNEFFKFINKEINLPEKSIILTFDDGLKCHHEFVLPELKKRNMWGFFFINSGVYINNDFLDVHKIHLLTGRFDSKILLSKVKYFINENKNCIRNDVKQNLENILYKNYITFDESEVNFKKILNFYMEKESSKLFINKIFNDFFPNIQKQILNFYLSIDEIKNLDNNEMLIGNHTVNHYNLASLNNEEQKFEIEEGCKFISKIINKNLKFFSFPFGGKHVYNDLTLKILKNNSTFLSFDNNPIDININNLDLLKIPRYDCNLFDYGKIYNYKKNDINHVPKEINLQQKFNNNYSSITIFTSNHPRHLNLVNLVSKITDIVYVVIESTTLFKKRDNYLKFYFDKVKQSENKYFGNIGFLENNVKTLNIQYNDASKLDLKILKPALESEVILVYGASWIKSELCEILERKNAINIHAGISPYYRGSGTTFWPIYDNKLEYVGATIHKLALKLDAGEIFYTVIPIYNKSMNNLFDFTMYVIKITQETLLEKLKNRDIWRIKTHPQNKNLEIKYTKNNDFNENIAYNFLNNEPNISILKQINYDKSIYFNPIFK